MSAPWLTIAVLCAGTVAIKSVGPIALGGNPPSERVSAVIRLIAPALLAALIVYEALSVEGTARSSTRGSSVSRSPAWRCSRGCRCW